MRTRQRLASTAHAVESHRLRRRTVPVASTPGRRDGRRPSCRRRGVIVVIAVRVVAAAAAVVAVVGVVVGVVVVAAVDAAAAIYTHPMPGVRMAEKKRGSV